MKGFTFVNSVKRRILNYRLKRFPELDRYTQEYLHYLDHLFGRAARAGGFDYLCTLLRVEGIKSGHWDAFVESEEAAMDFSKILRGINRTKDTKRALRLGLLIYCHSIEISAIYEILANFLRCIQGKVCSMYPFAHLVKVAKGKKPTLFAKRILPKLKDKIHHLRELAQNCGEERLIEILDSFFRNDIRNAFYHSDYAISDEEFRIIEGREPGKQSISLEELSEILTRCFAFYSAFFICYNSVKRSLTQGKRFHRWANYEVLEILSENNELTGFKVHFPTGSYAMFERKKYKGTTGLNLMRLEEGVQLNVGDIEKYRNATDWLVDGKPFDEYGTRYNPYGFWKPIVFRGDSTTIQNRAMSLTNDKVVQGSLFYIYATGHKAIEFVLKSDKPIFKKSEISLPYFSRKKRLVIKGCDNPDGKAFIYDGTIFLDSKELSEVQGAIQEINLYMQRKFGSIKHSLKYQMYSDVVSTRQQNPDGSFTVTRRMDDPRSTLAASNLSMFPRADWRIREEWI